MRLFPYYLIPVILGLALLGWAPGVWPAYAFLGLAGVSQGCASATMTAVWAELYGRDALGSVKSIVSMLGVLGTAFGPVLMGILLQMGVSFATLLPGCLVLAAVACALSFVAQAWMIRQSGLSAAQRITLAMKKNWCDHTPTVVSLAMAFA